MFGLLGSLALLIALVSQAPIIHAQETVKLRASVVANTFGFGPVWVASKQGFFNQQKLDVEVLLIR
jgi:ABC-type nitrate/sulfonate/bicarbonate transport system substrate-binding protein